MPAGRFVFWKKQTRLLPHFLKLTRGGAAQRIQLLYAVRQGIPLTQLDGHDRQTVCDLDKEAERLHANRAAGAELTPRAGPSNRSKWFGLRWGTSATRLPA